MSGEIINFNWPPEQINLDIVIDGFTDVSLLVPKTTKVNGHELTGDITISASDVGLSSVTNDAQVKRSEMGQAFGVATLNSQAIVPDNQLPAHPGSVDLPQNPYYLTATSRITTMTIDGKELMVAQFDTGGGNWDENTQTLANPN